MPLLPPSLSLPLTTSSSFPSSLSSFFRARDGKPSLGTRQGFYWAAHSHTFLPLLSALWKSKHFQSQPSQAFSFSVSWDPCVTTERLLWVSEEIGPLHSIETAKLSVESVMAILLHLADLHWWHRVPSTTTSSWLRSTWKAGGRTPLIMSFWNILALFDSTRVLYSYWHLHGLICNKLQEESMDSWYWQFRVSQLLSTGGRLSVH